MRMGFIDWFAEFAVLSLDPVPDKPFMKASVHITGCAFSMWTMPLFLRSTDKSFLEIIGSPRSGKSSIARAGLIVA
jgi:hypothetical protein